MFFPYTIWILLNGTWEVFPKRGLVSLFLTRSCWHRQEKVLCECGRPLNIMIKSSGCQQKRICILLWTKKRFTKQFKLLFINQQTSVTLFWVLRCESCLGLQVRTLWLHFIAFMNLKFWCWAFQLCCFEATQIWAQNKSPCFLQSCSPKIHMVLCEFRGNNL